jgi:hypothetical protein
MTKLMRTESTASISLRWNDGNSGRQIHIDLAAISGVAQDRTELYARLRASQEATEPHQSRVALQQLTPSI